MYNEDKPVPQSRIDKILSHWDEEDFFDIQSRKLLDLERQEINKGWSEAFAESYNKEIDMYENAKPEFKTQEFKNLVKESLYGKDHINPQHYKNVAAGKQYMELMVDMLQGKSGVEAHLFGQVYKYLMRCGSKDQEVQELNKALWYLQALIKYKSEGKVL
jgi:coenzyme F420-reducing hydrogenase alpha subunit